MYRADASTFINSPLDELRVVDVRNHIVTRSMFAVGATGINRSSLFENLPLRNKSQMYAAAYGSILRNPLRRLKADKRYFLVINVWATSYHHWLTEAAIKFLLFEKELLTGTTLLPRDLALFITEFLKLFKIEDTLELNVNVFVPRLSIITNPNSGHYYKPHLLMLRDRLFERLGIERSVPSRKIYVARKTTRGRRVLNDDEVIQFLSKLGFECLDLENAAFVDQVKLFSECKILVSVHGAALTNAIFMPQEGRVIELYPDGFRRKDSFNACYYRMCTVLGIDHDYFYCEREFGTRKFSLDTDNIVVNCEGLDRLLSRHP